MRKGTLSQRDPLEEEARARGVSVDTLRAFYAQRSSSLTHSNTTTRQGAPAKPRGALAQPQQPAKPKRSGILGYVLDAWEGATGSK